MEDEMEIIFSSFLFTFLAIKALRPIADKVGLLDMPNYRKHHQGAVPLIGGVAIFIGVAITSLIFMTLSYQQKILLGSSLIIVLLGVFDDLRDISVRFRLFVQASCTIFIGFITKCNIVISRQYVWFFRIKHWRNWLSGSCNGGDRGHKCLQHDGWHRWACRLNGINIINCPDHSFC